MTQHSGVNVSDVNLAAWFPVEHDANGKVTVMAAEAIVAGETHLFIIRLDLADDYADNGCDCPNCAPHEQVGPVPPEWWYVHALPRCTALNRNGSKCRNVTDHPSGMCGTHRKRAAR